MFLKTAGRMFQKTDRGSPVARREGLLPSTAHHVEEVAAAYLLQRRLVRLAVARI